MRAKRSLFIAAALSAGSLAASTHADASAFYLHEQSVMASGRAFAGSAAATDDTGIVAYNPAGMTELKRAQAGFGGYVVKPKAALHDTGSNLTVGGVGPLPVGGAPSAQGFDAQLTGYAYAALPLSRDLWFGLAVTVPFGLKDDYDADAFNRYDSLKSKLVVVDFAPSLAYRVNDLISLGGSLVVERANATLANALPNPLDPQGPNPTSDGLLSVSADDWAMGFTLGLHIRPTEQLDVGLTYRSSIKHDLNGTAVTDFAGGETSLGAKAKLDMPEIYALGLVYKLTDTVKLLASAEYYGWNSFKEIRIRLADTTQAATTEDFRNTWNGSIGADVRLGERLNLRGGVQYDETPTRDAYRSSRMPDANRLWAAVGASYILSNHWAADLSYTHDFKKSVVVNRVSDFPMLATTVRTQADVSPTSNVVGLGLRAIF